jgi:cell division protein DivIC
MSQHQTVNKRMSPNPGMRRRIRFLMFIVLCLLIWAVVTVWDQSRKMDENSGKLTALNMKLADESKTNENMKQELVRLNDPEYRGEIARKQQHLSKPGEIPFDIPKTNP